MTAETREKTPESRSESRVLYRTDFLLAAGTIAVIAGLLFPLHARILDILVIFSISLTAAVLLITFSAEGAGQVQSLPSLLVVVTSLRLAVDVACAKLIILQGRAGTFINLFGGLIGGRNLVLAVLVFCLLSTVVLWAVFRAARRISMAAAEFADDVVPVRQVSMETALGADIINESHARALESKTSLETKFFLGMNGAGTFMLYCGVIELVIIIVNIVASLAMGAASPGWAQLQRQGALALGAGALTIVCVFAISAASSYLVSKSFVRWTVEDWCEEGFQEGAERIVVTSNDTASAGDSEEVHANRGISLDEAVTIESTFMERECAGIDERMGTAGPGVDGGSRECFSEWLKEGGQASSDADIDESVLWCWEGIKDGKCYEVIVDLLEQQSTDEAGAVLMGAESVYELPVTAPVNIAMELAKRHKRCLLVDLDWERDAIAKVFDVRGNETTPQGGMRGIATCISNLWICPASSIYKGLGGGGFSRMKDLFSEMEGRYDRLLIYAPNIKSSARWEEAAGAIGTAILFGKENGGVNSSIGRLGDLLKSSGGNILKPSEVHAGSV